MSAREETELSKFHKSMVEIFHSNWSLLTYTNRSLCLSVSFRERLIIAECIRPLIFSPTYERGHERKPRYNRMRFSQLIIMCLPTAPRVSSFHVLKVALDSSEFGVWRPFYTVCFAHALLSYLWFINYYPSVIARDALKGLIQAGSTDLWDLKHHVFVPFSSSFSCLLFLLFFFFFPFLPYSYSSFYCFVHNDNKWFSDLCGLGITLCSSVLLWAVASLWGNSLEQT